MSGGPEVQYPYVSDMPGPWLVPFQYTSNFESKPSVKVKKKPEGPQTKEEAQKKLDKKEFLEQMNWSNFTQSTTFHGVKYIFDGRAFKLRRLIWLACVVTASTLFSIQVIDRCRDYFKYRSNVNVEIIYVEEVEFPSVTICNQNTYRITEVVEHDLHEFIQYVYKNSNVDPADLTQYELDKYDIDEFTLGTAHQEYDFIDSCTWKGRPCNISEEFVTTVTEFGVCYTFNGGVEDTLYVTQSGSGFALNLILNIEQYEYMTGPQDEAGIKVLLHDPSEVPMVKDLGFSIAPGTHTLVGVQRQVVHGLTSPHGSCDNAAPPRSHCIAQCRASEVIRLCQCRAVYQPPVDNATICDMATTFTCVKQYRDTANQEESQCQCGVPCRRVTYTPELSYAHISKLTVDRLSLSDPERNKEVEERYKYAREVSQRVTPVVVEGDARMLSDLIHWSTIFADAMEHSRQLMDESYLIEQAKIAPIISSAYNLMTVDFKRMDQDYKQKKATSSKNCPELKALGSVFSDFSLFMDYTDDISMVIQCLVQCSEYELAPNTTEPPSDYWTCDETESQDYILAQKYKRVGFVAQYAIYGLQEIEDMVDSYVSRIEYLYGDTSRPSTELPEYSECIQILSSYSEFWKQQVDDLTELALLYLNSTSWTEKLAIVRQMEPIYNLSQANDSILKKENFEVCDWYKPDSSQQDKANSLFTAHTEAAEKSCVDAGGMILTLKNQVSVLSRDYETTSQKLFYPIKAFLAKNMTKLELYQNFSSQNFRVEWQEVSLSVDRYMVDLKQFTSKLLDLQNNVLPSFFYAFNFSVPIMNDTVLGALQHVIHAEGYRDIDPNLDMYLSELNVSRQHSLMGVIDVLYGRNRDIMEKAQNDIIKAWQEMKVALELVQTELESYAKSAVMDDAFFTENYIKLDIFYKELSYEIIRQQVAFEFLSLVSEIGGFMGLLLGASILTMCELLDYLAIFFLRRCRFQKSATHSGSYLTDP